MQAASTHLPNLAFHSAANTRAPAGSKTLEAGVKQDGDHAHTATKPRDGPNQATRSVPHTPGTRVCTSQKKARSEQDSNLRVKFTIDVQKCRIFESIALTTRPSDQPRVQGAEKLNYVSWACSPSTTDAQWVADPWGRRQPATLDGRGRGPPSAAISHSPAWAAPPEPTLRLYGGRTRGRSLRAVSGWTCQRAEGPGGGAVAAWAQVSGGRTTARGRAGRAHSLAQHSTPPHPPN